MKCLLSFRDDTTVKEVKDVTEALCAYLDASVKNEGMNDCILEYPELKEGYSNVVSSVIDDPFKCDIFILDEMTD